MTRGIVPIRFDPKVVLQQFGYYQFRSSFIQKQIVAGTYGAALMQINIRDLRDLRILVPELETQRRIVERLQALGPQVDRLSRSHENSLLSLEALRQSLLHKAFSGQLT